MRIRPSALALSLLVLSALPESAHADPFVGRLGTATTVVRLRGTDGKAYQATFTAIAVTPQSGAPTYSLDVSIAGCSDGTCAMTRRYAQRLTGGQITATADMTAVTVRVTMLGAPLTIAWTAATDPSPTDTPGLYVAVQGNEGRINADGRAADVRATVWGATCRAQGTYSSPYTVAPDGYASSSGPTPPKSAPPQFAKRARKHVTCLA